MQSSRKNLIFSLGFVFLIAFSIFSVPVSGSLISGLQVNEAWALEAGLPTQRDGQAVFPRSAAFPEGRTIPWAQYLEEVEARLAAEQSGWEGNIGHWLGNFFLTIGGAVAGMGGLFFDLSIDHLVLKMGHYVVEGGIGEVVNAMWGIVRDVVNLAFIFGFVYIGLRTILDPGGSGYRKFLAQLIIAALLVNFSLFFVKLVIDVANVASIEVSQLMKKEGSGNLGTAFATEMGINEWYGNVDGKTLENLGGGGAAPAFYIMATLLLIIVGVTFASAAFMIVIRFVALILFMIGSPLYFAAMVFPQASKFTKISIPMVLGYAFYPAIFLFLMYISLQILGTSTWSGQGNQLAELFAGEQIAMTNFTVILQFSVAIALIIVSMRVSKSMSLWGAGAVVGTSEKVLGNVFGSAPKYFAGGLGRRVSEGIDDMRKSDNKFKKVASLGLRSSGVVSIAGSVSKAKFGTGTSRAEDYKVEDTVDRARARAARITKMETKIKAGTDVKATVRGATPEQLVEMFKHHKKGTVYDALVSSMSAEQVSNVMKSKDDELDDETKAKIGEARKAGILATFAAGAGAATVLAGLQPKDVAKLPKDILVHPTITPLLTAAMLKAIADADSVENPVDRQTIRTAVEAAHPRVPGTPSHPAVQWLDSPSGAIF